MYQDIEEREPRRHRYAQEEEVMHDDDIPTEYESPVPGDLDDPRNGFPTLPPRVGPRMISAEELKAKHLALMQVSLMWFAVFCCVLMLGASVLKYLGYMFS